MKCNKASGLDGFTVEFYKKSWLVIEEELIEGVQSFFKSGKLLTKVLVTIITLNLKKLDLSLNMGEFRPVA